MSASPIIARRMRLVHGNSIIALVDLEIVAWKLELRNCRWKRDAAGERIATACGDLRFTDPAIERSFQAASLAVVRELARQAVTP